MKVGVALHFCTDDTAFLRPLLSECWRFTEHVVIAYYDHFFDGQPEDMAAIAELKATVHGPVWVEIPFPGKPKHGQAMHRLHGMNRVHALRAMPADVTHALLIDSDEIPDGKAFRGFKPPAPACRFLEWLYWQSPTRRCRSGTGTAVMLERSLWPKGDVNDDRGGLPKGAVIEDPMIHHFSWARSLEQIERKMARWPFPHDDMVAKVRAAWTQPFTGRDCLKRSETRVYEGCANTWGLPCSTT